MLCPFVDVNLRIARHAVPIVWHYQHLFWFNFRTGVFGPGFRNMLLSSSVRIPVMTSHSAFTESASILTLSTVDSCNMVWRKNVLGVSIDSGEFLLAFHANRSSMFVVAVASPLVGTDPILEEFRTYSPSGV